MVVGDGGGWWWLVWFQCFPVKCFFLLFLAMMVGGGFGGDFGGGWLVWLC